LRIALGLEYDGQAFCGWQSQATGCGVQDAVETALGAIAGHAVSVLAAGRTDAGVHATGQVVHFDTHAARPDSAWVRGVNAHLPVAARVLWARETSEEFHARFSARSRSYRYLIYSHPIRPALMAGRLGWTHLPLDVDAMASAAAYLLGEHDFSSFRAAECQARTPVKTLSVARIRRAGELIVCEFTANAFLHHMVRNLVGALVYVGAGKHSPEWMRDLLAARERTAAPPTFAAAGLYFERVEYDARFGVPPG